MLAYVNQLPTTNDNMITKDKVRLFDKYDGDVDSWARSGSKKEKSMMADGDWHVIEGFVHDLFLVTKGLASPEFRNNLNGRLSESCEGEETIRYLQKLAGKR